MSGTAANEVSQGSQGVRAVSPMPGVAAPTSQGNPRGPPPRARGALVCRRFSQFHPLWAGERTVQRFQPTARLEGQARRGQGWNERLDRPSCHKLEGCAVSAGMRNDILGPAARESADATAKPHSRASWRATREVPDDVQAGVVITELLPSRTPQ